MNAAADAAGPTPEERLWAADPTTPATVLAQLALFPELRPLVREHPTVYPDLVAWIDAQTEAPDAGASAPGDTANPGRRVLMIAVGIAAVALAGAGVTLGVVQPWAPVASTADPLPSETAEALAPTPTPTPTPEAPVPPATVPGTVAVRAGANLRAEPSASSAKIGAFNHNAVVDIICFTRGDTITDALGTTDVWYSVGGGYISAAILQASDPDAVMPCE
jgi:hypothetical protein